MIKSKSKSKIIKIIKNSLNSFREFVLCIFCLSYFMNLNRMKDTSLFDYKNITLFVNIIIIFFIITICLLYVIFSEYIYEGIYSMMMNIGFLLGSISF